ncbi:hypothetical protein [Pseudomonas sp. 32_A]|uniref:hypothetical protein n=1 Tax=Pseudomonas sp. 32_A TaxID=2813559 RepID=UPI001A9F0366|nr:hypothetical protein [Pseudomonas sp. 32_A]
MKRVIKYEYRYLTLGCDCCHDSSSSYCMYEDGALVDEDVWCEYASNEEELREILAHLEPFDVHPESEWF